MRASKLANLLLDHRPISQNPTVHGAMVDLEAPYPEHFLKVSIAECIAQMPGHRLHDEQCLEIPAFEIIFRLALQLLDNCNSESWLRSAALGAAISLPVVDWPFTKKICGRPRKPLTGNLSTPCSWRFLPAPAWLPRGVRPLECCFKLNFLLLKMPIPCMRTSVEVEEAQHSSWTTKTSGAASLCT